MKVKRWLMKIFDKREKRLSPWDREQRQFEELAREQFIKLKEKGLSIPIVSL